MILEYGINACLALQKCVYFRYKIPENLVALDRIQDILSSTKAARTHTGNSHGQVHSARHRRSSFPCYTASDTRIRRSDRGADATTSPDFGARYSNPLYRPACPGYVCWSLAARSRA